MYQKRIYGLRGATKKMATQNKSKSPGGEGTEPPLGPALDGDTAAEDVGSTTGSAPSKSGVDLRTEAAAK